jgi:transcriptional regulator with GAF, ATPase, and Fis domain
MVQHSIEKRRLRLENIQLRQEVDRDYQYAGIVGHAPKMQHLFGLVRSIADTDVAVLIEGETGTGKELIARAIHNNGPRRAKRFVAVNCGALAETLLESELFGHEKGAFTGAIAQRRGVFETADGGSLFLDEVGEISPSTQIRLLRVLQDGEFHRVGGAAPIRVDVRILSATNRRLEELVKQGKFRQDLYYRLHVFPLQVPPLRERREDIPLLARHFAGQIAQRLGRGAPEIPPGTLARLAAYPWPGNVRELRNAIERAMILDPAHGLTDLDLAPAGAGASVPEGTSLAERELNLRDALNRLERELLLEAHRRADGVRKEAARLLGIDPRNLSYYMRKHDLDADAVEE